MSFEDLLNEDKTFAIDHQLLIKFNKAINNLQGGNISEFFVRNNHITAIFVLKLLMQNYNTVFMLQRTKFY